MKLKLPDSMLSHYSILQIETSALDLVCALKPFVSTYNTKRPHNCEYYNRPKADNFGTF
jgi:hypothetical protein